MKGTVNEVGCMGKKWKVWLKCMCKGMRKAGIREWEAPVGLVFWRLVIHMMYHAWIPSELI